jgi:4-hydroxybenzoate polyprenyltransferase
MLNLLCLALLPLALAMIAVYSYTKRFTWLCHFFLGLTCAIAPMGSFLALSGRFELRYFFLAGAVALWVAGFDILYALLDIDFDRKEGLFSIPARFGRKGSAAISGLSHLGTIACLACLPYFWPLSWIYWIGVALAFALLAVEQALAFGGREKRIKTAAYSLNEVFGFLVLAFTAIDIYI